MRISTFDVFDTVLTRAVGSPESVFLLLGKRLADEGLLSCSVEEFACQRQAAEGRAYEKYGGRTSLITVYAELSTALKLDPPLLPRLQELECAVEADLVRCVPGAKDLVLQARVRGDRVIFISDIYLPEEFIRQQLDRFGFWEPGDACYVSTEWGKLKQTGELFAALLQQEGLSPEQVSHLGNSLESDLQPARRLGINARLFGDGNLNRNEQILEAFSRETGGLASVMAGAARLARLSIPSGSQKEQALVEVAAAVTAPVLTSYALWLLQRAQEYNLRRLYFLSRDGQVVLQIARRLAQKLGLAIDLHYLYASRQSWNLPAIRSGTEAEIAWIWDETDFLSVRSLLKRVGLSPEQLQHELTAAGFAPAEWDHGLGWRERQALKQLLHSETIRLQVVTQAAERRESLLAYLEQEGIPGETGWGIVDLGWFGSLQNSLQSILGERGGSKPAGFYFALFDDKSQTGWKFQNLPREAFLFNEQTMEEAQSGTETFLQIPDLIAIMEMFCAADHGTVGGFTAKAGRYEPVLKEKVNQPVLDWGLPLIRQVINRFVDELLLSENYLSPWLDLRPAVHAVLAEFIQKPSTIQASAWGSFPWEDGLGDETYWNRLAQPYTWRHVFQMAFERKMPLHHRSSWMAGSLALSQPAVRIGLSGLSQVFHAFRSLRYRLAARAHSEWQAWT